MLADEGYHVREAAGGLEALASLRTVGPVDLVLLDLNMPCLDGRQVCDELRRDPELCTIPVLICTASGEPDDLHERLGVAAYLSKPFDLGRLLATVAWLCRREHLGAPQRLPT